MDSSDGRPKSENETPVSRFGRMLRFARARRGLAQAEVASRLGLTSGQSISDWERGRGSPVPVAALKKLIEIYDLDPRDVFEHYLAAEQDRLTRRLKRDFGIHAKRGFDNPEDEP